MRVSPEVMSILPRNMRVKQKAMVSLWALQRAQLTDEMGGDGADECFHGNSCVFWYIEFIFYLFDDCYIRLQMVQENPLFIQC